MEKKRRTKTNEETIVIQTDRKNATNQSLSRLKIENENEEYNKWNGFQFCKMCPLLETSKLVVLQTNQLVFIKNKRKRFEPSSKLSKELIEWQILLGAGPWQLRDRLTRNRVPY